MIQNINIALAIITFITLRVYKHCKREQLSPSELINSLIGVMTLYSLVICLIGMLVNPTEVTKTPELLRCASVGLALLFNKTLDALLDVFKGKATGA